MSSRPCHFGINAEMKPRWPDDTLLHLPLASDIALRIQVHQAAQNGWEALLSARSYHHRSGHFVRQTREVPHQTGGEFLMYFHTVTLFFLNTYLRNLTTLTILLSLRIEKQIHVNL